MTDPRGGAWLKTATSRGESLAALSFEAEGVWWKLSHWCARTGARGFVPWDDLHVAMDRKLPETKARRLVEGELVRREIVTCTTEGVDLGDFWREENPAPEVWHDPVQRARWARGKALRRDTELCNRIKARDRNLCRYCGVRVNWNDKVGPSGGTYDHVDPDGPNSISNVVVSCRQCNGRKRDRTPEQWISEDPELGLPLLRPGTTATGASRARAGPTPGQPPVDPRSTRSRSSRARPDRVNSGPTPSQPDSPPPDAHPTRPDTPARTRR